MRKLPWRRAPYLSLDFETTGLDLAHDRVVSFGAVPIEGDAIRMGGADHRVVDAGGRAPSRTSVQIHRLRPVDVATGISEGAAADALDRHLRGRFLIAWYADVEIAFCSKLFGMAPRRWDARTIDVRDLYLDEAGRGGDRTSLSAAAAAFGVPVADPHQALDDALVTAQLFLVLAAHRDRREGRTLPVTAFVRSAFA